MYKPLIGLSLSFCVADIARGHVKQEEVRLLITGTKCYTQADWDEVIGQYREAYWDFDPDKCEQIARHFISSGLVKQPRLEGKAHNIARGHWIKGGVVVRDL